MSKKLVKLTEDQLAKLDAYKNEGILIGLSTGPELNEDEVLALVNKFRVSMGLNSVEKLSVFDSPHAASGSRPEIMHLSAFRGQFETYWIQNMRFWAKETDFQFTDGLEEDLETLFELSKRVGYLWNSEAEAIVTRKPVHISLIQKPGDGPSVLHNMDDYAIKYVDGHGTAHINGMPFSGQNTRIPLTPRENITLEMVMSINNTEVRNEAMKKVDRDVAFNEANGIIIDEATIEPGGNYTLYSLSFDGVNKRIYLKGNCPSSGKRFDEPVPPSVNSLNINSCERALCWRERQDVSGPYIPPLERT